jgi:hypothetical protein
MQHHAVGRQRINQLRHGRRRLMGSHEPENDPHAHAILT